VPSRCSMLTRTWGAYARSTRRHLASTVNRALDAPCPHVISKVCPRPELMDHRPTRRDVALGGLAKHRHCVRLFLARAPIGSTSVWSSRGRPRARVGQRYADGSPPPRAGRPKPEAGAPRWDLPPGRATPPPAHSDRRQRRIERRRQGIDAAERCPRSGSRTPPLPPGTPCSGSPAEPLVCRRRSRGRHGAHLKGGAARLARPTRAR
jgi:hypothetical protein